MDTTKHSITLMIDPKEFARFSLMNMQIRTHAYTNLELDHYIADLLLEFTHMCDQIRAAVIANASLDLMVDINAEMDKK